MPFALLGKGCKGHNSRAGCSRNGEICVHAERQCYAEIWKQGRQGIARIFSPRAAVVF